MTLFFSSMVGRGRPAVKYICEEGAIQQMYDAPSDEKNLRSQRDPYSISLCSKTWKPAFSMAQLASAALAGSAILRARTAMSSVVEKQ